MLENDVIKNPIKSDNLPSSFLDTLSEEEKSLLQNLSDDINIVDPGPDSKEEKMLHNDGSIDEKKNNLSEVMLKNTEMKNTDLTSSGFVFTTVIPLLMALLEPPEMTRVTK